MESVERIILDAWRELAGSLWSDGRSLDRRFDRRRRGCRAVRGWSLAIRASDSRLGEAIAASPERMEPDVVDLDPPAIRWLCGGASLTADRVNLRRAAAELGQSPKGLLTARVAGAFTTDYVRGLGGKWGKPHPLLSSDLVFDPATRGLVPRDPLWASALPGLIGRIRDDWPTQTLRRRPRYQKLRDVYADTGHLHPEHPANDPQPTRGRRRKSLALPPPPPDEAAWYKWRGDQYVGYDWRNPYAAARYHTHQRHLETMRAAAERRRRENPPPPAASGSLALRGWDWICPSCSRRVQVLFLPIAPIDLSAELNPADPRVAPLIELIRSTPFGGGTKWGFACEKCHRIKRYSHCDPNAWNEFLAWASGGLLFGRDVAKPDWLAEHRKLEYTPRPHRQAGVRTGQVESALLAGESFQAIADKLKIARGTVLWHAQQVYKRHGVKTLSAFLTKNGLPAPISKREQVRQRVMEGQPVQQIAQEMNLRLHSVYDHIYMLRKSGKLPERIHRKDAEDAEKTRTLARN